MMKHGIWLCMMGSSVLHLLILILLTRAVSTSQIHIHAMETYLLAPYSCFGACHASTGASCRRGNNRTPWSKNGAISIGERT